ncbi:molybdopterin-guanine dinucleotide biosynthesis protein MobB [Alteribacillus persepolensis]|nr:molybdopterin-guanine dinucleotide biosynthesis protein MobB [Alteribacillus persepolensis]
MNQLIARSAANGYKTAAIKHHGHGGKPAEEVAEKDSRQHLGAGAAAAAVEGEGSVQIQINQAGWTLEDTIALYQFFSPDMIFVEGYKHAGYPKVVLLRGQRDAALLKELSNIFCAVTWEPIEKEDAFSIPVYTFYGEDDYVKNIWKKVKAYYGR